MYLKFLQKPRCVGLFKQAKRSDPQWRKQGWIPLERQFHSEKLSFFHKKEAEHSFELSLSICVLYRRIFNLELQNFSLEKKGKGRGGSWKHAHDERPPAILLMNDIYYCWFSHDVTKIQTTKLYRSYWDFTFTVYYSSWKLIFKEIFASKGFLVLK